MLISIKFSNYRSYFEPQEFSMLAIPQEKQYLTQNSFELNPALYRGRLLKSSMILGLNATGKSNLLGVCRYLRYLVLFSSEAGREKRNIFKDANEQFAFFESAQRTPVNFEVEFLADNNTYFVYSISVKGFSVEHEMLSQRVASNGERLAKTKCLFERRGNEIIQKSDEFAKLLEFVEVKSNVLLLSNCNSDIKDDICPSGKMVINWFAQLNYWNSSTSSIEIYDRNADYLDKAAKILMKSDKTLKNLRLEKKKLDIPVESQTNPESVFQAIRKSNIELGSGILAALEDGVYQLDIIAEYNLYSCSEEQTRQNVVGFSVFDSSSKISIGQSKLIRYLAYIIEVLENGGILFLDELDCHLHHQFPKLITDAFNDSTINKNNAQLIFTTHSTSLIDNHFRRDQINIVSKNEMGISSVSHPERQEGRVKSTNSLSKLWLENSLNKISSITIEDLKNILTNKMEENL